MRESLARSDEEVNVIRHDDVIAQIVTLAVEVIQAFLDDGADCRLRQVASGVSSIEPLLQSSSLLPLRYV